MFIQFTPPQASVLKFYLKHSLNVTIIVSRPTNSGNSITMENEIVDAEARRLELKRLERIVMKMSG